MMAEHSTDAGSRAIERNRGWIEGNRELGLVYYRRPGGDPLDLSSFHLRRKEPGRPDDTDQLFEALRRTALLAHGQMELA